MRAHPGGGCCCPEQEEGESAAGGSDSAMKQGGQGSALAQSPVSSVRREGARRGGRGRGRWKQAGWGGGVCGHGWGRGLGRGPGRGRGRPPSGSSGLGGCCCGCIGGGGVPRREPVPFPSGSMGAGPRGPRATKSGKRMDCTALSPDGRRRNPSGKKFRSKPQLARYLGNTVDVISFDFRTGKMRPSKLQKNKQRLRNDPLNQNKFVCTFLL
uniref:MBD domain-containing protein n=1 Tax=Cebus imitator TaxID=2715852 RepID=A0A2K5QL59_CEBIM